MAQTIGLVLAGGEGRRMGRPKGAIPIGDTTLSGRAASALHPLCGNVLVSLAPGASNPAPACTAVEDEKPGGRGPLAGIAAGFTTTGRADLLVLACDYPAVATELLRAIRDAAGPGVDVVFPVDPAGRDHPLVALWRRSAEALVRAALAEGAYKVQTLLADLEVRRLLPGDLPAHDLGRALRNVNWPADLFPYADPD